MSEDVNVDKNDLAEVEKDVLRQKEEREQKLRAEIEAKIKKDMEEERLKKEKENKLKELEERNRAMEEMLKQKEIERQKEIEELKSQIGHSKAIHNQTQTTTQSKFNASNYSDDDLRDVNEASLDAFLKKQGLTRKQLAGR